MNNSKPENDFFNSEEFKAKSVLIALSTWETETKSDFCEN
jgi:hypothetical protein